MRNQKLRFTFGHILAYISLIFIGYISFLGLTYWGDGNFILSGILTGVMVLILLGLMTYLQGLKAVARYFKIRIKIERICLLIFLLFRVCPFCIFGQFFQMKMFCLRVFPSRQIRAKPFLMPMKYTRIIAFRYIQMIWIV